MIFAFINDNQIKKIEENESFDQLEGVHNFQIVIDITDITPPPQIGWTFESGALYLKLDDVTPRQIRQALILSGVSTDMIETALNTLPEPTRSMAKTEWEYSIAFQRRRPIVAAIGTMLGWTPAQIDDLWALAAKL